MSLACKLPTHENTLFTISRQSKLLTRTRVRINCYRFFIDVIGRDACYDMTTLLESELCSAHMEFVWQRTFMGVKRSDPS